MSAILSAVHIWAFALGLGGVFFRGYFLKLLRSHPEAQALHLKKVFLADNVWGVAALLWLVTGLLRAFAGYEKGTEFYLQSTLFWVKMALFAGIFIMEIYPMWTLIKWRLGKREHGFVVPAQTLSTLIRLNTAETHITLLIPLVAAFMARGY